MKKQTLLFVTALSLLTTHTAYGEETTTFIDPLGGADRTPSSSSGEDQPAGSSGGAWHTTSKFAINCEKLTIDKQWARYRDRTSDPTQIWNFEYLTEAKEKGASRDQLSSIANSYQVCHALLLSSKLETYTEDSGKSKSGNTFKSFSAGAVGCLNQQNQEQQQQCMAESAQEMSCRHNGYETQDYDACVSLLKFADGFFIAKQGLQAVQTVQAQVNAIDSQTKVQNEISSGNDATVAALGAQRDGLKQNANMAMAQGALDAGKAATLWAKISSYPTKANLKKQCMGQYNSGHDAAFLAAIQEKLGSSPDGGAIQVQFESDTEKLCAMAIDYAGVDFILNEGVLDELKALAIQSGVEAAANMAKGALLNNMAGKVEDTMNEIESFEPPEFEEFDGENAPPMISECIADPTIEGCPPQGSPQYQGFAGTNFNATMGGASGVSTGDTPTFNNDDASGGSGAGAPVDRSLLPNKFGSAIKTTQRDNSFKDGIVAAGTMKAGSGPTGGGGGGGGGGASPPGKAPQTGGGKQAPASGITSPKIKTAGTGMGAIGGRGRLGARKSKSSNPFSKLLGKGKASKNGVLNFRGPAQIGKGGSIFQMITRRYNDVQSKKRLIEYKKK